MALSGAEQKVCERIGERADALLDDLRLHVGLPTGGGNAAALDESRERLCWRLRELGATIELVPGEPKPEWLYGAAASGATPPTAVCRRVKEGGKGVLIAGHLDTVHDPRGSFRELTMRADGKTATGPGCVDMKGGLVIGVAALEAIDAAGMAPELAWSVLLNSDEETGSYHSAGAIRAEAASGRYVAGLALEPATPEGGLVTERSGAGQFMIEAHGKSAHVGRDFASGVSAVNALAEAVVRVSRMPRADKGLIANIGPVEGGIAANVVPDRARAWGNVRFPDEKGAAELAAQLDALATPEGSMPRVIVRRNFDNRPSKPLTPGTERLALLARSCAEDLGQKLPFSKTAGVCDGNIMQAAGLATIDTLGVRGGGLHTPQEWIEVGSLVERCQMLAVLVMRLGGGST